MLQEVQEERDRLAVFRQEKLALLRERDLLAEQVAKAREDEAKAGSRAEAVVAAAEAEAGRVTRKAHHDANVIIRDAQRSAQRLSESAAKQVQNIQADIRRLEAERDALVKKVKSHA